MKKNEEYEPFGQEWQKEMMKLSKNELIHLYRIKCIKKLTLHDYTRQKCIAFQQWLEARPVCGEWLTNEQLYAKFKEESSH